MARNLERRVRLADAAVAVLARQGSRGLTHRAIDAEAAVPRGTASNYFASRDEIVDAILHRIGERLQPDPETHAALAEQAPTIDLFAAYLRDIVHRLTADRDAAIALLELRLEATRRPRVAETLAAWLREGLRSDIEFTAKAGLPGTAADVTLLHYALDGLILDQLTVPIDPDVDPDAITVTLAHRLLRD
ncbi:MAG: TetR/AcrR family transcriptional regulator [Leucobacter sp.]